MSGCIPPAERPRPLAPPVLAIDPEEARQAFAVLGEQLQALVEAIRPSVEQMLASLGSVGRAFAALNVSAGESADVHRRARSAMRSDYARRRRRRVRRA